MTCQTVFSEEGCKEQPLDFIWMSRLSVLSPNFVTQMGQICFTTSRQSGTLSPLGGTSTSVICSVCVCVCVCVFLTMVLKLSCLGMMLLQARQSFWQSLCPGSHRQSSSRATTVFMVPLSAAAHRTEQTHMFSATCHASYVVSSKIKGLNC